MFVGENYREIGVFNHSNIRHYHTVLKYAGDSSPAFVKGRTMEKKKQSLEPQKRYIAAYMREFRPKFNKRTEPAIVEYLESRENVTATIRAAILATQEYKEFVQNITSD